MRFAELYRDGNLVATGTDAEMVTRGCTAARQAKARAKSSRRVAPKVPTFQARLLDGTTVTCRPHFAA